jgi:hypothetical protein
MLVNRKGEATVEGETLQCSYLFYDTNLSTWVRSGKVSRPFADRYKEHRASSKLSKDADRQSRFYRAYPSVAADQAFHENTKGVFEDLEMYCAVGYKVRSNATSSNTTDHLVKTNDGIFLWTNEALKNIQGRERKSIGDATIVKARAVLVDYLLELCYELLLSSVSNASTSSGFEIYMKK